jgi:hypothetical protein
LRNQLLRFLKSAGDATLNKVNKSIGVRFVLKLKINSIMHLLNAQTFLSSIVLYDQLFKEQESTLVVDSLSKLNLCDPQMRRVRLLAVIALQVYYNEFNDEALLKKSTVQNFFLYGQLYLNTFGMRLGPNESRIN